MSAKDMELNLTDGMKHREKKHKDKKQNGTDKRKSRDEDNEEPRNPKRHRRDVSCSDSTGSISSSLSAASPASEDTSSGSYVLDNKILEMKVSRVAESLAQQNIPGGSSGAGLSGRGLAGPEAPVAGISGAGPRTKAKQKIWYREAAATTSLGLKQNSSEEEKYAAMELEDE